MNLNYYTSTKMEISKTEGTYTSAGASLNFYTNTPTVFFYE